jgi:hypothetical protein
VRSYPIGAPRKDYGRARIPSQQPAPSPFALRLDRIASPLGMFRPSNIRMARIDLPALERLALAAR